MTASSNDGSGVAFSQAPAIVDPARMAGIMARLDGITAEVDDWSKLEDAARDLVDDPGTVGGDSTTIVSTALLDALSTVLDRIDARRPTS